MFVLNLIWFFMAAGLANMSAAVSAKIFPNWSTPIDFGYKLKGKEFFGSHKTWRGVICGTIVAEIIFILQRFLWPGFGWYGFQDLPIYFGGVIGFGAIFGDLVESFFKRRLGVASGKSWFPFDQVDWVIGALVFSSIFVWFNWMVWLVVILVGIIVHVGVKYIGFILKLDDKKI